MNRKVFNGSNSLARACEGRFASRHDVVGCHVSADLRSYCSACGEGRRLLTCLPLWRRRMYRTVRVVETFGRGGVPRTILCEFAHGRWEERSGRQNAGVSSIYPGVEARRATRNGHVINETSPPRCGNNVGSRRIGNSNKHQPISHQTTTAPATAPVAAGRAINSARSQANPVIIFDLPALLSRDPLPNFSPPLPSFRANHFLCTTGGCHSLPGNVAGHALLVEGGHDREPTGEDGARTRRSSRGS